MPGETSRYASGRPHLWDLRPERAEFLRSYTAAPSPGPSLGSRRLPCNGESPKRIVCGPIERLPSEPDSVPDRQGYERYGEQFADRG